MINKRTLSYVGSVLAIVLFSTGIVVMAAGLSELPSVPSNTTQATSGASPAGTSAQTESEQTVLPTDATASVTILETGTTTAGQPAVDVIAQSTVTNPGSGDGDENDGDERPIDPSIQLLAKNDAIAIALAHVGDGTIVEIDLKSEDNPPLYDIKLIAGGYKYEIKIHAITGAVLDLEKERVENADDSADD